MVYDSTDGYLLMFGGQWAGGGPYQYFNDTWTFAVGHWTNRTTGHSPEARFGFFLADDPADHEVVLFGGNEAHSSYENDTWVYHAGTWTNVTSGVAPPGAFWGSMSYDTATGTVILFGGNEGGAPSAEYTNNTWAFHAGTWTALSPAARPPGRDDQNQVDDVADGRVLMFGGLNTSNYLNDTWSYSGGSWSPISTAVGPDLRAGPGLAYDSAASAVVMYGGFPANTYYYATWILQGGTWTRYDLSPTPGAGTIWGQMAYDAADGYVVLFQGDGAYNATWELNFTGGGAPPPSLSVTASATPTSGSAPLAVSFTATATGGTPPYSYAWSFGDGATSASQNPSHIYARAASDTARLNVTDSASGKFSKNWTISVSAAPLGATISAQPATTLVDENVTFTSTVSGGTGPDTFLWEFGDHSSSPAANATHLYTAAGTYRVTFVVNDSRGASVTRNVTVTVSAVMTQKNPAAPALNVIPIAVGILLILVLVLIAFLWYRRRRKPTVASVPAAAPPAAPPPPPAS